MTNLPGTLAELREQVALGAARGEHVFTRTITIGPPKMSPAVFELNMMGHLASFHGFALAEVLRIVDELGNPELSAEVLDSINDIGANGDDGRCADIWPQVQEALATRGGVGTVQWDEKYAGKLTGQDPTPTE